MHSLTTTYFPYSLLRSSFPFSFPDPRVSKVPSRQRCGHPLVTIYRLAAFHFNILIGGDTGAESERYTVYVVPISEALLVLLVSTYEGVANEGRALRYSFSEDVLNKGGKAMRKREGTRESFQSWVTQGHANERGRRQGN